MYLDKPFMFVTNIANVHLLDKVHLTHQKYVETHYEKSMKS